MPGSVNYMMPPRRPDLGQGGYNSILDILNALPAAAPAPMPRDRAKEMEASALRRQQALLGTVPYNITPGSETEGSGVQDMSGAYGQLLAGLAQNRQMPMFQPAGPNRTFTAEQYAQAVQQYPYHTVGGEDEAPKAVRGQNLELFREKFRRSPQATPDPYGSTFSTNTNAMARDIGAIFDAPDFRAAVYPYLQQLGLAVGERR
jgi:hypothetical protein